MAASATRSPTTVCVTLSKPLEPLYYCFLVGFSRSSRAFALLTAFTLGALAAPACGGQSFVHTDGDSGTSGDAGTGHSGEAGALYGGSSGVGGTSGGYAGTIDYG